MISAPPVQVTDIGVESLCCQVTILDKRDELDLMDDSVKVLPQLARLNLEDPEMTRTETSRSGCAAFLRLQNWLKNTGHGSSSNNGGAVLVEVKQVLHPICSSLRHLDITDTSITNTGLQQLCKKIHSLQSLGEYSISDSFLRSLCVVSSMKIHKYPLVSLHTRKVSYTGMYNLVHTFPLVRSLTCWEPLFEIGDLAYLPQVKHVTLIRIRYRINILIRIVLMIL